MVLESCWDLVNGNDVRGANSVSRTERSFEPLRAIRCVHVDYDVAALDVDELDRCGNNLPIMEAEDNKSDPDMGEVLRQSCLMLDALSTGYFSGNATSRYRSYSRMSK